MIQTIELEKNVQLLLGKNIINPCTYVSLVFTGGHSVEKYLEQAHLAEHIVSGFDYKINGEKSANLFLGSKKADARVERNCMMFSFCINSINELRDEFNILSHCLNDIVISDEELQREKITILDELIQADISDEYVQRVKKDFEKITAKDIYEYILNNLTADNLKIYVLSNMDAKKLIEPFNEFVNRLKLTGKKNVINSNQKQTNRGSVAGDCSHIEIVLSLNTKKPLKSKIDKFLFDLLLLYANNFRYGIKLPLRHKNRLVYRTDIASNGFEAGDLILTIKCKDENAEQVIELSKQYFDNLFHNGISYQEFEFIKQCKLDFLKSRPFHIPQPKIKKLITEYEESQDRAIDEAIQKDLLSENQQSVKEFDNNKIEKAINDIQTLKAEEFNKFIREYFENADIKISIINQSVCNV